MMIMNMRYILVVLCLLGGVMGVCAQRLEFRELSWDFGTIEELGGDVTHSFEFRNTAEQPVVIHNVKTTCGCTTPEFSRRPIAVGESSTLKISFDPRFRPGRFRKEVYLYSTLSNEPLVLYIEGRVTPRVLSTEERYPYTLGSGARLGAMYITIGDLCEGEMMQTSVEYYNGAKRAMDIEFRPRKESKHLKLFYDREVAAGEGATLEVGYYIEAGEVEKPELRDTVDIFVEGRNSGKSLFLRGRWHDEPRAY